jgi:hypothetical protein
MRRPFIPFTGRSIALLSALWLLKGCALLIPGGIRSENNYTVDKRDTDWRVNFPRSMDAVKKIPHPDSIYVFIMAGQSNMAGRGFVEPQDTIPDPRILTIDSSMNWIYAKEPLHFYEPSMTGLDCGMSFARALLPHISEGFSIVIIPTAVGGSSIEQWLYNETHRNVELLENFRSKTAFAAGYGKIVAILWHQGESNASREKTPIYTERLDSLFGIFRTIAGNDSLPIIMGELGSFAIPEEKQQRWDTLNAAIHFFAEGDSNITVVSAKGLDHKGDYVHFDGASQRKLGKRFAEKFIELFLSAP